MARYDTVDEGIINADLSTVFKAYMDEFTGKTHWWMPLWESKPRGEKRVVRFHLGTAAWAAPDIGNSVHGRHLELDFLLRRLGSSLLL